MISHDDEIWVFLSHSNLDYDNVRRVRDLLENDGFRPIMFYLKCLEDNNDDSELESLLSREIDSRNRFILCNSKHTNTNPRPRWVEFEVNHIKSRNRYYQIIDIESNDEDLKKQLSVFRKNSTAFISYARNDQYLYDIVQRLLRTKLDYKVFNARADLKAGDDFAASISKVIDNAIENGFFIPVITKNSLVSTWCWNEICYALQHPSNRIIPLVHEGINANTHNYDRLMSCLGNRQWVLFNIEQIDNALEKLSSIIMSWNSFVM